MSCGTPRLSPTLRAGGRGPTKPPTRKDPRCPSRRHPRQPPRLALNIPVGEAREQQLDALWAMSPAERIAAMWRGDLTLSQLSRWSSRAPARGPAARRRVRLDRDADTRMGRGGRRASPTTSSTSPKGRTIVLLHDDDTGRRTMTRHASPAPTSAATTRRSGSSCPAGHEQRLPSGASRTPTHTAAATATRPAQSTSTTAPGTATAAAPKAARSTQPRHAAIPTGRRST